MKAKLLPLPRFSAKNAAFAPRNKDFFLIVYIFTGTLSIVFTFAEKIHYNLRKTHGEKLCSGSGQKSCAKERSCANAVYENDREKTHLVALFLNISPRSAAKRTSPPPVLLKTHILNFAKFNHVRFYDPRDFMEEVDFDYLLLENIIV